MFGSIVIAVLATAFICIVDFSSISLDKKTAELLYLAEDAPTEKVVEGLDDEPATDKGTVSLKKESIEKNTEAKQPTSSRAGHSMAGYSRAGYKPSLKKEVSAAIAEPMTEPVTEPVEKTSSVNVSSLTDEFIEGVYDELSS